MLTRREFLARSGLTAAAILHPTAWRLDAAEEKGEDVRGKADSCIFLWLGGGACHLDTWDPKRKGDGRKVAGSAYDAIPTAVSGVSVCQHLSRTAKRLDRCALLRTLHHDVIDEHAAATNRLHTGFATTGTLVYPSVGSVVAHQKGARQEGVPAYVVMGYPNVTRGPGFLGAKHGYIYLTETDVGPNGLVRPPDISDARQARREALLEKVRAGCLEKHRGDEPVADYSAVGVAGLKLAGPQFMSAFDLKNEPATLREVYGGEFGQRCLLARRLVQSGVRFVEVSFNLNFVNGTGWDTHNEGQQKQHVLIDQLDQALAALIQDLEGKKLLDRTLIVVATEFGRPAEFDSGGGRGHQSQAFSAVLVGGGLRTGRAVGETDELGKRIVSRPISVPDFHATIYAALGINPARRLYDGDRPVPITDAGKPVSELFV
ncbi:MAG: DUF1501 domain-containing protein [Gemmataceae bacterium]|nr:DUF1501 domain-containing protein [Gemmataceae bacterium]